MKEIERDELGRASALATRRKEPRNAIKRASIRCSICARRTWLHATHLGIVAAERSPYVYAPTHKPLSDRTWILVMAWGFAIAMLLHLVLIVMLAFVAGH